MTSRSDKQAHRYPAMDAAAHMDAARQALCDAHVHLANARKSAMPEHARAIGALERALDFEIEEARKLYCLVAYGRLGPGDQQAELRL